MTAKAESPEQMEALGRTEGNLATAGMVIALVGGLGAGKTHWTKGFAAGVGANDVVTSPTFGLVHEYRGPALKIFHFDFYRIATEAEMVALGWDEYLDEPAALLVVEWANKFPELLPKRTRWLNFKISPCGGREITWV